MIKEKLTLSVRWISLARFLGLWGSFDPLIAMKSSSFSLFVNAITNFGHTTAPPVLMSCAVSDDPEPPPPTAACWWLSLLWLLLLGLLLWWWVLLVDVPFFSPVSGEARPLIPLLFPFITIVLSEFLQIGINKKAHNMHRKPFEKLLLLQTVHHYLKIKKILTARKVTHVKRGKKQRFWWRGRKLLEYPCGDWCCVGKWGSCWERMWFWFWVSYILEKKKRKGLDIMRGVCVCVHIIRGNQKKCA